VIIIGYSFIKNYLAAILWHFPIFLLVNYMGTLSSSFNLSFFNYFAFSVPALGLYINFFSKVLCILYYGLLRNFKYPLLAYYLAILLLNAI
jgi:hypothetical protein